MTFEVLYNQISDAIIDWEAFFEGSDCFDRPDWENEFWPGMFYV